MLGADAYAQLVGRHVELASDVAWPGNLLDEFEPIDVDHGRRRPRGRSGSTKMVAPAAGDGRMAVRFAGEHLARTAAR
jgi:hypothetical protein